MSLKRDSFALQKSLNQREGTKLKAQFFFTYLLAFLVLGSWPHFGLLAKDLVVGLVIGKLILIEDEVVVGLPG